MNCNANANFSVPNKPSYTIVYSISNANLSTILILAFAYFSVANNQRLFDFKSVTLQVHDRASENLRKLLLLDYPYPAILDDEESGNSEGSKSEFKWKK